MGETGTALPARPEKGRKGKEGKKANPFSINRGERAKLFRRFVVFPRGKGGERKGGYSKRKKGDGLSSLVDRRKKGGGRGKGSEQVGERGVRPRTSLTE